ncbi:aminotransferase class V-fold PLP-dependent enzyme [Candidatus Dependentiae bacterium]
MDIKKLREDFPILKETINDCPLVYLDNAATTQRPKQVLNTLMDFYTKYNSNIHRSVHAFGEKATVLFEGAREKIANFINAAPEEVIFTSGTTEGINFAASTWGMTHIAPGDHIVISEVEHHSNMIPWQQVALKKGATIKFISVGQDGNLDSSNLDEIITPKTKLVAVTHASNVLGSHIDVKKIIKRAKEVGAKTLIDAAQSAPHQKIDVKDLDCDFLAFSGHKMLAPTGIGALFIKREIQEEVPPYQFGGGMVFEVDYDKASWCHTQRRFEAGTQPIAQAIGFGAAIDYLTQNINFEQLEKYEAKLCKKTIEGLQSIGGIRILGPVNKLKEDGHLVSFVMDDVHSHDVSAYLASFGIATRAGHNCAQPLAKKIGIEAAVRASFYFYNTEQEVDYFLNKMEDIRKSF